MKRTTADRIPPPYHEPARPPERDDVDAGAAFRRAVTVRVLSSFSKGGRTSGVCCWSLESTGRPVAMGAVRLRLDVFEPPIRARILGEQVPLGRILSEAGIAIREPADGVSSR